jgi:hypothetical protein
MLAPRLASRLGQERIERRNRMRELLFLLLLLACPLAMFIMMRSGHGHSGHGHSGHGHGGHRHTTAASESEGRPASVSELRRWRGELDRLIEERERAEVPVASEATSARTTEDSDQPARASSAR